MLLGYSAAELNRQVTMCAERKLQRVREAMRPGQVAKRLIAGETKPITISSNFVQTMEWNLGVLLSVFKIMYSMGEFDPVKGQDKNW